MVENGVVFVNVALVALDGVVLVLVALFGQRGRDDVAARGEDTNAVARDEGDECRGEDEC